MISTLHAGVGSPMVQKSVVVISVVGISVVISGVDSVVISGVDPMVISDVDSQTADEDDITVDIEQVNSSKPASPENSNL